MDYAKAATIISDVAPTLIIGPHNGLAHINVYKANDEGKAIGAPFSIMLPTSTEAMPADDEEQEKQLIAAIEAAKAHLNA